jgi:cell division protein ZapA
MGQVAIPLNGKSYRFVCGDGEEARILALGEYLRSKLDALGHGAGRPGDDRMLVMAALLIADELFDARTSAEQSAAQPAPAQVAHMAVPRARKG